MSDAGDEIEVDAPPVEVEVEAKEAPKGKLSVEDALQVNVISKQPGSILKLLSTNSKCSKTHWCMMGLPVVSANAPRL